VAVVVKPVEKTVNDGKRIRSSAVSVSKDWSRTTNTTRMKESGTQTSNMRRRTTATTRPSESTSYLLLTLLNQGNPKVIVLYD
jgi:hypothetical protein